MDDIRADHVTPDARFPELPEHYGPFLRLVVDAAVGDDAIGDAARKTLVDFTVEVVDTGPPPPRLACVRCGAR